MVVGPNDILLAEAVVVITRIISPRESAKNMFIYCKKLHASSWLMDAVCLQNKSKEETVHLTPLDEFS